MSQKMMIYAEILRQLRTVKDAPAEDDMEMEFEEEGEEKDDEEEME